MMKFRQKIFTIEEGYYSGPKDMDNVPGAVETVAKSTGVGAILGGVAGKVMEDSTILRGAFTGGKYGALGGVALKLVVDALHKPIKRVSFTDLDKTIRRQFGMYSAHGLYFGDTEENRGIMKESFSFNDRDVQRYKINVAITDGVFTLYTLGLGRNEMKTLNEIIDRYCKKWQAMNYTSQLISSKSGFASYSVRFTLSNYYITAQMLNEIGKGLKTRINILDSRALVENRISEIGSSSNEEKRFSLFDRAKEGIKNFPTRAKKYMFPETYDSPDSVPPIDKYSLYKIFWGTGLPKTLLAKSNGANGFFGPLFSSAYSAYVMEASHRELSQNAEKIFKGEVKVKRGDLENRFLWETLKYMGFKEGKDFTVGDKNNPFMMYLFGGILLMTTNMGSKTDDSLRMISKSLRGKDSKKAVGELIRIPQDQHKVAIYRYELTGKSELIDLLSRIMNLPNKPTLFTP